MAPGDGEDELDEGPFAAPLPPADRLWRHPSEVAEHGRPRGSARVGKLLHALFRRSG